MKKLTRIIAILLLLPLLGSCEFVNQFLEDTTTESGDETLEQVPALPEPFYPSPIKLFENDLRLYQHMYIRKVNAYQSVPLEDLPEYDYMAVISNRRLGEGFASVVEGDDGTYNESQIIDLPIYCIEWCNRYHDDCDFGMSFCNSPRKYIGGPYVVFKYRIDGEIYYRYKVYNSIGSTLNWYMVGKSTSYEVYHQMVSSAEVLETVKIGDSMEKLHEVTGVRLYDTQTCKHDSQTHEVTGTLDVLVTDGMVRVQYSAVMEFEEYNKLEISYIYPTYYSMEPLTITEMTFYPWGSDVVVAGEDPFYAENYDMLVALPNGPVLP